MKMKLKEKVVHFIQDPWEAARKSIRLFKDYPGIFRSTLSRSFRCVDSSLWKEFENTILSDPVVFKIALIVYLPPEQFDLRIELTYLTNPIRAHRYLVLFTYKHCKSGSGWEDYLRDLAHDFMVILSTDYQRLLGKPGTISELRENFEKISTDEDGTIRIEIDQWPQARRVLLIKKDRVEDHVYQLKEESGWFFNNLTDEMMIEWMQSFKDRELRDTIYEFKKGDKPVLCYVYGPDGKLKKGCPFPCALKNKYEPLISEMARKYPLDRGGASYREDDVFPDWKKTDAEQEAELAFYESIRKYRREKGSPPGFFKMSLLSQLSDTYQRAKKANIDFGGGTLDQEMEDGTTKIKIMRGEPKSDSTLLREVIEDLCIGDPVDRIIAENYGKSDSMIAAIIKKRLAKSMTKQAVRKRRINKVKPLLRRSLQIRSLIRKDEER